METWSRTLNSRQRIRDMREKKAKKERKKKEGGVRVRTSFFHSGRSCLAQCSHSHRKRVYALSDSATKDLMGRSTARIGGMPSHTVDSLAVFICNHQATSKPTAIS
jgi:ribosomal protein L18